VVIRDVTPCVWGVGSSVSGDRYFYTFGMKTGQNALPKCWFIISGPHGESACISVILE